MPRILTLAHVRDVSGQVMAVVQEPLHPLLEAWQAIDHVLIDALAREQRHQPDNRPDAQRRLRSVDAQLVVIKAVLLVPESGPTERVHGVGDRYEMLEECRRHVL